MFARHRKELTHFYDIRIQYFTSLIFLYIVPLDEPCTFKKHKTEVTKPDRLTISFCINPIICHLKTPIQYVTSGIIITIMVYQDPLGTWGTGQSLPISHYIYKLPSPSIFFSHISHIEFLYPVYNLFCPSLSVLACQLLPALSISTK